MTQPARTVAVVGASRNRSKFGNKAVRAYLAEGWTVYPVNPGGGQIEGLTVVEDLYAIEEPIDRVTIYLPPAATLQLLPDLAELELPEIWFNPGSADEDVLDIASRLELPFWKGCSIVDIGRSPAEFA